jgi:hypothetical protein
MGELDEIDPLTEEFRQLEQAVVQHAQRERKRGRGR